MVLQLLSFHTPWRIFSSCVLVAFLSAEGTQERSATHGATNSLCLLQKHKAQQSAEVELVEDLVGSGMVTASHTKARSTSFWGPWKTTIASDSPEKAKQFAIKYLGASDYNQFDPQVDDDDDEDEDCLYTEWVYFPSSPIAKTASEKYGSKIFQYYQFHFVYQGGQCNQKGAPLKVQQFGETALENNAHLSVYTAFEDKHVNMETTTLDPLVASLAFDKVPFLVRKNNDHTYSLFVLIPFACVVHIISPHLTVVTPPKKQLCSEDCTGIGVPDTIKWDLVNKFKGLEKPGLKIKRSVFASTAPAASAELLVKYFPGRQVSTSLPESSNSAELQTVRWASTSGLSHEFVWIHRPSDRTHTAALSRFERYLLELRGNLSQWSYLNWEPFMNNHVGLLIEDCGPIFQQLQKDHVPYFLGEEGYWGHMVFSIIFQDPSSNLFEFVCLGSHAANAPTDEYAPGPYAAWVPHPHPPKVKGSLRRHLKNILRNNTLLNDFGKSHSSQSTGAMLSNITQNAFSRNAFLYQSEQTREDAIKRSKKHTHLLNLRGQSFSSPSPVNVIAKV